MAVSSLMTECLLIIAKNLNIFGHILEGIDVKLPLKISKEIIFHVMNCRNEITEKELFRLISSKIELSYFRLNESTIKDLSDFSFLKNMPISHLEFIKLEKFDDFGYIVKSVNLEKLNILSINFSKHIVLNRFRKLEILCLKFLSKFEITGVTLSSLGLQTICEELSYLSELKIIHLMDLSDNFEYKYIRNYSKISVDNQKSIQNLENDLFSIADLKKLRFLKVLQISFVEFKQGRKSIENYILNNKLEQISISIDTQDEGWLTELFEK